MTSFAMGQKRIDVYPSTILGSPVIYLNTFSNAGNSVYKKLLALGCPDFSLVAISKLKWDHDMTPWYMGPISKHDTPCTGGADDYLKLLLDEIMPEAEKAIPGTPKWRGIAGYSLAGLFAMHSLYKTDVFSRVASMSGSFWFEGFPEFVHTHEMKGKPDCMYFSIGDKESSTNNPILNVVQRNTEEIETLCRTKGVDTTFVLNKGNHFQECNQRTASGIYWILNKRNDKEI